MHCIPRWVIALGVSIAVLAVARAASADEQHETVRLTAENPVAGDEFGFAVALSGDEAFVGARYAGDGGTTEGRVFVFAGNGVSWTRRAVLSGSDAASGDRFGATVSLSGNDLIVGAYGDDDAGEWSGSAYVFSRDSLSWSQDQKITAGDPAAWDQFGHSVAIDGNYAIVGSLGDDVFGQIVSLCGDYALAGAPGDDDSRGAAYVFKRSGTS